MCCQWWTLQFRHRSYTVFYCDHILFLFVTTSNSANICKCIKTSAITIIQAVGKSLFYNLPTYVLISIVVWNLFTKAVHKETDFLNLFFFTYNLMKLVTFKVLPSTPDTPLPTFFLHFWDAFWSVFCGTPRKSRIEFSSISIFFYFFYRLKSVTF